MIHNNESPKDLEKFTLDGRNQREQKSKTCACWQSLWCMQWNTSCASRVLQLKYGWMCFMIC